MTKDQEVSKWYAEQMGICLRDGYYDPMHCTFTINEPACQMAILNEWIDSAIRYTDGSWSIKKGTGNNGHIGTGDTIKEALVKLAEALRYE